jgi:hypothetical protein
MIAKLLSSFFISFLMGFFVVSLLWRRQRRTYTEIVLLCCLAVGFGFGLSSCLLFGWLCFVDSPHFARSYVVPEVIILISLGVGYYLSTKRPFSTNEEREAVPGDDNGRLSRMFSTIFVVVLLSSIAGFLLLAIAQKHGDWDAWAVWNLRARFLARGTEHWRTAFVQSEGISHADYPLLLPLTIARGWKYLGSESFSVPIILAFLFTFASVGVLWSSLVLLRGKRAAYLAGTVVLGVDFYVSSGASQYADIVIGFFMMCTLVILALYRELPNNADSGLTVLGGLAAGFAAWTKNEGLLFLAVFVGSYLVIPWLAGRRVGLREASMFMAGLIPVLMVIAWFKAWIGPVYYLRDAPTLGAMQYYLEPGSLVRKLTTASRYQVVGKAMAKELLSFHARKLGITPLLALYSVCALPKDRRVISSTTGMGMAIVGLMLVGYFFVYVTTPMNLVWHLNTSLSRLVAQLWPSVVFVLFMAISAPESGGKSPA